MGQPITFDFDTVPDRHGTNSLKYDFAAARGRPTDVLPMWVADMDFPTAPCVREALERVAAHGIYGYSEGREGYFTSVAQWFSARFGYTPEPSWLIKTPGVVYALAAAVRSLTAPGDEVLLFSPVYYPFYEVVRDNGRKLTESRLVYRDGRYAIDFADLERQLQQGHVRLLLFCSPHNPVGRVWTQAELEQVGMLCRKYHVLIVSDEIHCDFVWPGHRHIPFPVAVPEIADRIVLCTSPSKTFNVAGLQISNCFVQNADLRLAICAEISRTGYSQVGTFGLAACEAAYTGGGPWLDALREYLWNNFMFLKTELETIPGISLVEPEGTYLGWLDCGGLGLEGPALEKLMLQKAKLWLDSGSLFGAHTAQFQRINVACPRATLAQAIRQLRAAVETIR